MNTQTELKDPDVAFLLEEADLARIDGLSGMAARFAEVAGRLEAQQQRISELETKLRPSPTDGWVLHSPGPCPCDLDLVVQVALRDEAPGDWTADEGRAGSYMWTECSGQTIIAWRTAR